MARQMKDSGVEWIGDIPQDWSVSATKYLFNIQSGTTPDSKKEEFWDGYIRWVTPADFKTNDVYVKQGRRNISDLGFSSCSLQIIPTGSIIFSKRAPVGSVVINNTDLSINQGCLACMNKGQSDTKYYYYVMAIATEQYELHSSGTTFKEISAYTFSNFKLPHPPNDRQRVIADYIDAKASLICKVVDQTRATIEEYKKLKQAIITEAVTKGVRGPRPMKPSGVEWIGDIPVGWYTSKAGRFIASTQNGLTRRDLSESSGDIVLKLRNITPDGTIDYSAVTRVKLSDAEKTAYTLEKGDFLFVRVNGSKSLVGKSAIFDGSDEDVAYNDHIIRVRLETNYSRAYFKWFLLSTPGKTEIDMRTSTSAGQFTISGQELRNIRLCVPSEEEQQEIATYLDAKCAEIDRIIQKKEQLIEELGSYKKSLIYEYVTGKKEVKTNMELKVPRSN